MVLNRHDKDRIVDLTERLIEAERERDEALERAERLDVQLQDTQSDYGALEAECDELRAEVARLKAALAKIEDHARVRRESLRLAFGVGTARAPLMDAHGEYVILALAALAGEEVEK